MSRVLVTGGAGFIGSHLATALVERGDTVRVVDNLSTGSLANLAHLRDRLDFIELDLLDESRLADAVRGVDLVFHHAALASVPLSVKEPVRTHHACATATMTLLDACRKAGVQRLVYAASSSCYGNRPETPKKEDQLPQTLSPYAAAKIAGEFYCEAISACSSLETVRLRYFNVFGPRQDPNSPYSAVIPLFISAMTAGRRPTIFGDGSQSRDFTYVQDVVDANLLAARAPGVSGQVYNIARGIPTSVMDLLRMIGAILNKPVDPVLAPPRAGDVLHSWADIGAARHALGYAPRIDLETGLRKTIEWYLDDIRLRSGDRPATDAMR